MPTTSRWMSTSASPIHEFSQSTSFPTYQSQLVLLISHLFLVHFLQFVTHTTRLWAEIRQAIWIGFALTFRGPRPAISMFVLTNYRANSTCFRALGQHHCRVFHTLISQRPNCAFRRVVVCACATSLAHVHAAAKRTGFHHVSGVACTFALFCPPRAVVVCIFANRMTHAACHRTVHVHEIRI